MSLRVRLIKWSERGPALYTRQRYQFQARPRGDKFSITSRQHLEYLQRQRQIAEQELATQKAILAERKKELAARMALAEVQKETVFSS